MWRIERRSNARIERSALDEVRAIQTLLHDAYRAAGDGRTLVRELVQNADDAEASRLVFMVRDKGFPDATNTLLRGPALLVANDGPFRERDWRAIHQALGGSKAEELGKIGCFGVGLKSAFHVCEAIAYLGAESDILRPGVLNPWAGTGDGSDADPIHPDWDSVDDADMDKLLSSATSLLGGFRNGLLLWIPLRQRAHLDRAEGRQYGLGEMLPSPEWIRDWFRSPDGIALLLAQCAHLNAIEAFSAGPDGGQNEDLIRVERPDFRPESWVGRPTDDGIVQIRQFHGFLHCPERTWEVHGVNAVGAELLRQLRARPDWPHEQEWVQGVLRTIPRKALGHAAVTILRTASRRPDRPKMHIRWAVFLPLDNDPHPRHEILVEGADLLASPHDWEILLHGYFWPSHDRRSIPGVASVEAETGGGAIRAEWNRAVRDELLLPLLPSMLADAVARVDGPAAVALLTEVVGSRLVRGHLGAITSRDVLLPVLTVEGISFEVRSRECRNVSVPHWERAPGVVRARIIAKLATSDHELALTREGSPRIGGAAANWPLKWLEHILECVPAEVLDSASPVLWAESLVRHVIGRQPDLDDDRTAAVADWLGTCIGDGALTSTISQDEGREELRDAWRRLFRALPHEWLLDTPIESQSALVELACVGLIGRGLLPVPLGRNDADAGSNPDQQRIDRALRELGKKLAEDNDASHSRQRSRLLLAERLLAARVGRQLSDDLTELPLLRAHRLPAGQDEAWSLERLGILTRAHRVFSKPGSEPDTGGNAPADFRRAVHDLASGLGEDVWIVEHDVARFSGASPPRAEDLAAAVIAADEIRSIPMARLAILRRLSDGKVEPVVRAALRVLLSAAPAAAGEDTLYFVRSHGSEVEANERSLAILLRLLGRPWGAVDARLAEALPQALCDDLGVRSVDSGKLQQLLSECLEVRVDWLCLTHTEVLHILERLYSSAPERREKWCAMPIHRRIDGRRGPVDHRTVLALGSADIPPELDDEVVLLDPDPEVENLYSEVPKLDGEGILQLMLASPRPERFAHRILGALRSESEERVMLPRNPETRELLRRAAWLPTSNGFGVAPDRVLLAPAELHSGLAALAVGGCLGEHRLSDEFEADLWDLAKPVIREILQSPSTVAQVKRIADAVDTGRIGGLDEGVYLILPSPSQASAELVGDVLQTPVAGALPGWTLLRAAVRILGDPAELDELPAASREAVLALARPLCSALPPHRQVELLRAIAAGRPGRESPGGRALRTLLTYFAAEESYLVEVLPHLDLPTQDGQWNPASEIARSTSGLARRHLLRTDLFGSLSLDGGSLVAQRPTLGQDEANVVIWPVAPELRKYFEAWRDRVPPAAVGAFLSLLGDGKQGEILGLASEWLGEDVTVEGVRRYLDGTEGRKRFAVKVGVGVIRSGAKRFKVMNLLGSRVEMEAGTEHASIFATDPLPDRREPGHSWEILLRDVEPHHRTAHELLDLLGQAVEWWAVRVLGLHPAVVQEWWRRWGRGSQAQVGPVRASILAHLPLTLSQLDVHEDEELQRALREGQRAQRKREQAPDAEQQAALGLEKKALKRLAELIRKDAHQSFLWRRVQEQMRRFGYREDSVILELAQNADDALAQAAEVARAELPASACRFVVRVNRSAGVPYLDLLHYGRPINDTGGPSFPAGKERQWDQDLYFMMLLNLSSKPGEVVGRSSADSTTGRFGLGFKSVHLISEVPAVVSGFLAFSIHGGLLPEEGPLPEDPDLTPAHGHRATRIRLPLRQDLDTEKLIEDIFSRFHYAKALIPVFARQLREVVVEGGPHPGVSHFDHQALRHASGWVVSNRPMELPGHGQWGVLRFRPADADIEGGTAAVAFGLRDGLPAPFPSDLPFLWNVTPTSESWGCGYAINGPFKLDPGRTHVSLDDPASVKLVDSLGEALGKGLIALHDSLLGESTSAGAIPFEVDAAVFVARLWNLLVSRTPDGDPARQALLHQLHGSGRGLSGWMQGRSVVPTEMPRPFPQRLPPLGEVQQIDVATGGLDDPDFCGAIAEITEIAPLIRGRCVVTQRIAERLRPFVSLVMPQLRPADLLATLGRRWGQRLTPERLQQLQAFNDDSLWTLISPRTDDKGWHTQLTARSQAGDYMPLRDLLIPRDANGGGDQDVEEELRRAALAPDSSLLAPEYIQSPEDLLTFRRLRGPYKADADTLADWFTDAPAERRAAALQYLLHGRLGHSVLERIVPEQSRPEWLTDYDTVLEMLGVLTQEVWRRESLLAALFPDLYEQTSDEQPVLPDDVKRDFFSRLKEWWDDEEVRREVLAAHEARSWPNWLRQEGLAAGLKDDTRDHWLCLMILGACQSLGMARPSQHRLFIENARREGWWEVFKDPDRRDAWMDVLRTWQDRSTGDLAYARWMSLFPAIYQLSRFLDVYRRLLMSAGRRPEALYRVSSLLAPRVDQALTGAGQRFDAPPAPLDMGKHWVLRELVRLKVMPLHGDHLLPDCWVPSEQVIAFLRPLGLAQPDPGGTNAHRARAVFEFLATELGTPSPHLHYAFDVPLRHVAENGDVGRDLGLEA